MEENEIITGNKLIADWMELPKCDRCDDCGQYKFGTCIYYLPEQMQYHASFDWLIPVCKEIKNRTYSNFGIENTKGWPLLTLIYGDIQAVYAAVIQFITYHNTLNNE